MVSLIFTGDKERFLQSLHSLVVISMMYPMIHRDAHLVEVLIFWHLLIKLMTVCNFFAGDGVSDRLFSFDIILDGFDLVVQFHDELFPVLLWKQLPWKPL